MTDEYRLSLRAIAEVAVGYFSRTPTPIEEVPRVIAAIAAGFKDIGDDACEPEVRPASSIRRPTPAQIRKSIAPDGLVSFENGKRYRSLRRHVAALGMSWEAYRAKWGLPETYPMIAEDFRALRSRLAKEAGLGQRRETDAGGDPLLKA